VTRLFLSLLFGICSVSMAYGQSGDPQIGDRLRALEESVRTLDGRVADLSALLRSLLPPAPVIGEHAVARGHVVGTHLVRSWTSHLYKHQSGRRRHNWFR
jgi:hypothetical protein